jgi:hypothetical protein
MTARSDLYDALVTAFGATPDPDDPTHAQGTGVKLTSQPDGTDPEPSMSLVVVGQDAIRPGITAGDTLQRQLSVIVVSRMTTPGDADDLLEALTEEVLGYLDDVPFVAWVEAARAAYRESFPCYVITLAQES